MSNIITGRQLRAAHILAGLTHRQLAKAVGVHERAALRPENFLGSTSYFPFRT